MNNIISIGGIGGSGTRVVADILQKAGFHIGDDLNESNDTLLFTLLFKRENILTLLDDEFDMTFGLFEKIMSSDKQVSNDEMNYLKSLSSADRTLHAKEWLSQRVASINNATNHKLWGWKEPNTHIVIEKIMNLKENLKFIYVYRNGLDMAYSNNQNQLKLWGGIFFNQNSVEINPKNSLKYWCLAHERMRKLQKKHPTKIYLLDFDKLCLEKEESLRDLSSFIAKELPLEEMGDSIDAPSSIGRHKKHSLENFDKEDLVYVDSIYDLKGSGF